MSDEVIRAEQEREDTNLTTKWEKQKHDKEMQEPEDPAETKKWEKEKQAGGQEEAQPGKGG